MPRKKATRVLDDDVEELRRLSRDIFDQAGAFLMRDVCTAYSIALAGAANEIVRLRQFGTKVESDLLHAGQEITYLEGEVDRLEAELAAKEGNLPSGDIPEGLSPDGGDR